MKKVKVYEEDFWVIVRRIESDDTSESKRVFLSIETGDVVYRKWLNLEEEDVCALLGVDDSGQLEAAFDAAVASGRLVEVPRLTHGELHQTIDAFIDTIEDPVLRRKLRRASRREYGGGVGEFLRTLQELGRRPEWDAFSEPIAIQDAKEFLDDLGVEYDSPS